MDRIEKMVGELKKLGSAVFVTMHMSAIAVLVTFTPGGFIQICPIPGTYKQADLDAAVERELNPSSD
jgi:hypothetical protein